MFKSQFLNLLIMLLSCHCSNQVFQEQPGCSEMYPIGTIVRLRCSVIVGYRIEWRVTLPGQTVELSTDLPGVLDTLRAQDITVESPDDETSLLVINATESTNGTAATCIAINRNKTLEREESRQAKIFYYGPPAIPINLTAIGNGVGSIRISWSSSISMERVFYILIAHYYNVNTSISGPIIMTETEETLVFRVENSSSCDVYITFQVTALNAAGSSGPSEMLTRSLPSLPDISAVEDSLELSLIKTEDGVTLSAMFQGITSCPEYPVTSYTLVLVDSEGTETRESSAVTSGEITLVVVDGLMEDSLYSYYIVATNMIGNSVSTVLNKTTSDVQGVSICLIENITYSIQCSYITGSDARGCVYTLVSGMEGVANITGTIDMNSTEGVQVDLPNVGDQLLVFDLERDNSTGTIPVRINLTQAESCENEEYTSSSEITDFSTSRVDINIIDPSDTDSSITEDTSDPRGTACICEDTTISLAAAAAGTVFIIILCVIIIITTTVIICLRKFHRNHVSPSIFNPDISSQERQLNDFNLSSPFKNEMGKGANDADDFEGLYNVIDSAHVGSSAIYDEVGGATVELTSLLEDRVQQVNNQPAEPPAKDKKNQTHQDHYSHLHHGAEISIAPKNSNKLEVVDAIGAPEVPKRSAKSVKEAEYAVVDTTGAPEVLKKSAKSVKDAEYAVLDTTGAPEVPKRSAKSVKDAEYAVVGTTGAPEVPKRSKVLEEYVKDQYQEECKD